MQTIIVICIIALAALFTIRRIVRSASGGPVECGCSGCKGCQSVSLEPTPERRADQCEGCRDS